MKGLPNSADLRRRLHAVNSFSEVEGILGEYLTWMERRSFELSPDAVDDDSSEVETAAA